MRDKCKLICLMCIIFILTLSGCGGAENAGVEGGVKKRSTVNWERGFQKGTLSEGSQMYALDYRELSHEHPEDNSHARLNVIRSVGDDYIDFRRYYLDDRSEYYLERIPMGGGETSSFKLHPRDWSLKGNGISDPASTFLSWDSKNNAYLRYVSKSEDWVSRLSTEEPKQREAISVGIMTWEYGADFMKSSLANFSRKYPQYPITVEKTSSKDNSKERMLIEVMNGKGPDVLYLSYEDLLNLKNQDALMCIDTLIPDATMDSLLPGVSEFGMIDGKLYGIPTCVDIKTMFTNRELWDGEGWTLDDILGLIKANPDISAIFSADDDDEEIYWTLRLMTQFDLAERKSKFIDWENGISCFEEKDFMNILETILYYEEHKNDEDKKRNDVYVSLQRDRIKYNTVLAFHSWRLSGETFFYLMNEFGENCYPIGVPSEDRHGNYMLTEGLLVVNANAGEEKLETIQALMEYLFSMDCQKKIHDVISVLDDMVDTRVAYDEAMDMYLWMDGTDDWIMLPQKEDGTTYVKEYKELLDSAVPYHEYCPIFDIVWEESIAFFDGERDALSVTRLIDNRVQLYLDENK